MPVLPALSFPPCDSAASLVNAHGRGRGWASQWHTKGEPLIWWWCESFLSRKCPVYVFREEKKHNLRHAVHSLKTSKDSHSGKFIPVGHLQIDISFILTQKTRNFGREQEIRNGYWQRKGNRRVSAFLLHLFVSFLFMPFSVLFKCIEGVLVTVLQRNRTKMK